MKNKEGHERSPPNPNPHEFSGNTEELEKFEKDLWIKLR